jgi:hypothetical protein
MIKLPPNGMPGPDQRLSKLTPSPDKSSTNAWKQQERDVMQNYQNLEIIIYIIIRGKCQHKTTQKRALTIASLIMSMVTGFPEETGSYSVDRSEWPYFQKSS